MFVSFQKKQRKQPDKYGAPLRIKLVENEEKGYYGYRMSEERFLRNNMDVYQFRLNHSYREDGKVKKKQWNLASMSYYDIATLDFSDYTTDKRIRVIATDAGITAERLWNMIFDKFYPLQNQIVEEFEASEEYQTEQQHLQLIKEYEARRSAFESIYGFNTYKKCYDFNGTLRNPTLFEQLKHKTEQKRQREEEYREQSDRARYERFKDKSSSYIKGGNATHSEQERDWLKQIYRMASKKFHPDAGGTEEQMKFLTKLKEQWGL